MPDYKLIACRQCDYLHKKILLKAQEAAYCARCNALLYKNTKSGIHIETALTLSAAMLLIIGNSFPIATIIVQGQQIDGTLISIVQTLNMQQYSMLALLVFFTLVIAPAVEIVAIGYSLLQKHDEAREQHLIQAYIIRQSIKTWVLTDVFMLGVVVALVKLAPIVLVKLGVAFWAFAGLMVFLYLLTHFFNAEKLWKDDAK